MTTTATNPKAFRAKKSGRRRKTLGWTFLTVGAITAAMWIVSGWWTLQLNDGRNSLWVGGGTAAFDRFPDSLPASAKIVNDPNVGRFSWRVQTLWPFPTFFTTGDGWPFTNDFGIVAHLGSSGEYQSWRIALWPIPLLLWTPAAMLLRSGILARRRATTNTCSKCGYSRAGLATGAPCPECGMTKT